MSSKDLEGKALYNAPEVVGRFNHIVHIDGTLFKTNGIGLKNITSLIVRKPTTFNVVRVICQFDLNL